MKNKILVSGLFLILILLSSCEKDPIESEIDIIQSNKTELKILFQYQHTNTAWGYSHSGWFLDNQGNIRGYNMPYEWEYEDSLGYIAIENLMSNYSQTHFLKRAVDLKKLNDLSALIEGTNNGKIIKLDCRGADQGKKGFYCFIWDTEKNKFKKQLLSLTGDCEQTNISSEAIQLTEYLNQAMTDPLGF